MEPLTARESEAEGAEQLADRLGDTTLASAEQFSVNTLSSVTTTTLPGPGKSVRNYKGSVSNAIVVSQKFHVAPMLRDKSHWHY